MKTKDLIAKLTTRSEIPNFRPDRAAGLARLATFSGRAGDIYDRCRNYDLGADNMAFRRQSGSCMKSFGGLISKVGWNSTLEFGLHIRLICADR
jgi:hypothetical protein